MGQLPEFLTVAEVAKILRFTDESVHRWCREGKLEFVRAGGFGPKRFNREYIENLMSPARATEDEVA